MGDKYDEAIAYLTDNPHLIYDAWESGFLARPSNPGSCLFARCGPHDSQCGCLTMVKTGSPAALSSIRSEIQDDERIPCNAAKIEIGHLVVFAEYQRRFDAMWPERTASDA